MLMDDKGLKDLGINEQLENWRQSLKNITRLEEELKEEKKYLRLCKEDLVNQFKQVGVKKLDFFTGETIEVGHKMIVRINKERHNEAIKWLRDNDHGQIIKNAISIVYSMGTDDFAKELKDHLASDGVEFDTKTSVHFKPLETLVKSLLAEGHEVPHELFHIHEEPFVKEKIG